MKKQIKVEVFNKEEYDGEWPPEDAEEFIAWFVEKVETIPEEYRATADARRLTKRKSAVESKRKG